jgi:hypothetical protein
LKIFPSHKRGKKKEQKSLKKISALKRRTLNMKTSVEQQRKMKASDEDDDDDDEKNIMCVSKNEIYILLPSPYIYILLDVDLNYQHSLMRLMMKTSFLFYIQQHHLFSYFS